MTRNRDLANLIAGGFTESDIPDLSASKITSGTFADARLSASSVTQHSTPFDDNKLVNDISTLALRQASNENKVGYNTNSMSVDVFQDSSKITNLTNSNRHSDEYVSSVSVSHAYETGNRTSTYTVTHGLPGSQTGAINNWIDGATGDNTTDAWYYDAPNSLDTSRHITFDLGSGNSKIYTGAKIYQSTSASCGTWIWQGSQDNSSYTDLSGNITWGGSASPFQTEYTWENSTAYRYIRIRAVSGSTSNQPWQRELEFRIGSFTYNATGSFEGTTVTAPSSISSMGAIITYQNQAGTNALNQDIVLKLSADNGSNYSTATLTAMPDFSSGIKMAKVNDLSVTAGTQLKYKLEFANQSASKEARIRGVSLQY
jgi:hypothetical protein